jgi:hypothetical protein
MQKFKFLDYFSVQLHNNCVCVLRKKFASQRSSAPFAMTARQALSLLKMRTMTRLAFVCWSRMWFADTVM